MPEWQRLAGKAAKEVEKFAKEKVDLVLMHWRDKMGIAQKEVRFLIFRLHLLGTNDILLTEILLHESKLLWLISWFYWSLLCI